MHSPPGIFTISLDFELYWGVRDCCSIEAYEANLRGARAAVLQMLDVFGERKIHATWATVGFLFFDELQQLRDHLPACRPSYRDANLCPYQYLQKIRDLDSTLHFASDLIDRILQFDGQELATHTFSHYYCLEYGQTRESFRSDLQSALEVAQRKGVRLESIVFPKNQTNPEYLTVLEELGITAYRGNPPSWVYQAVADSKNTALRRALRFFDSYCNLTGFHIYSPDDGPANSLINVPASRFLRPYNRRLAWLEPLRLRRITRAMTAAAESGRLFHLWWHPHNFGVDTTQNLDFLRSILNHYRMLRDRLGMESYNMSEVAQQWERPACPQQS